MKYAIVSLPAGETELYRIQIVRKIIYKKDTVVPGFSLSSVEGLERFTGLRIPKDYLEHIQQYNGGIPQMAVFKIPQTGSERLIRRMLCFIDDYQTSEYGVYDVEVVWSLVEDRLNEYLLPFAALFGGDLLCFDSSLSVDAPKVVVWDHELSEERAPITYDVAANFSEFLELLF